MKCPIYAGAPNEEDALVIAVRPGSLACGVLQMTSAVCGPYLPICAPEPPAYTCLERGHLSRETSGLALLSATGAETEDN
jgi:hypothetical protein